MGLYRHLACRRAFEKSLQPGPHPGLTTLCQESINDAPSPVPVVNGAKSPRLRLGLYGAKSPALTLGLYGAKSPALTLGLYGAKSPALTLGLWVAPFRSMKLQKRKLR